MKSTLLPLKAKKCVKSRLYFPKNLFCGFFLCHFKGKRGQQAKTAFFSWLWACPLWLWNGGWWLPVCQRPTSLVHFDSHMGAVMILKAAIRLTVAFQGSAWCRHCAAPIISSGNTLHKAAFCLFLFLFPCWYTVTSYSPLKYLNNCTHVF